MLTEAGRDAEVHYGFESESDKLSIRARGLAAHSSKPWDGRNAITHLAGTLGSVDWPDTQAARMVRLINDLVGTGDYAEKFGDVAYSDSFMGPRTLSLTMLKREDGNLVAGINIRQPVGRSEEQVKRTIGDALTAWSQETGIRELRDSLIIGAPQSPYCWKCSSSIPAAPTLDRSRSAAAPTPASYPTASTSAPPCPASSIPGTASTST